MPTAVHAADPVKLRVGFIPVLGSAQIFVIDGLGWAAEAGLKLDLVRFDSGPTMIQALASGQLDAYVGGVGPVLVARSQGVPVKAVAALAVEELVILARGPLLAAIDKAGGGVQPAMAAFTAAQGRKPKLAAQPPGSVPDTFLRYWLDPVSHVDPASVDILGIGIDATQQAFLSGAVDAAIVREPTYTLIRDRLPDARLIATGGQIFANQPGSVLAIYHPEEPARQQQAAILVKLVKRATDLIQNHPDQAAPPIHKVLGGGILPLDVITRALRSPASRFTTDPGQILEATAVMQDFQLKLGVVKAAVPVEQAFDLAPYREAAR